MLFVSIPTTSKFPLESNTRPLAPDNTPEVPERAVKVQVVELYLYTDPSQKLLTYKEPSAPRAISARSMDVTTSSTPICAPEVALYLII